MRWKITFFLLGGMLSQAGACFIVYQVWFSVVATKVVTQWKLHTHSVLLSWISLYSSFSSFIFLFFIRYLLPLDRRRADVVMTCTACCGWLFWKSSLTDFVKFEILPQGLLCWLRGSRFLVTWRDVSRWEKELYHVRNQERSYDFTMSADWAFKYSVCLIPFQVLVERTWRWATQKERCAGCLYSLLVVSCLHSSISPRYV